MSGSSLIDLPKSSHQENIHIESSVYAPYKLRFLFILPINSIIPAVSSYHVSSLTCSQRTSLCYPIYSYPIVGIVSSQSALWFVWAFSSPTGEGSGEGGEEQVLGEKSQMYSN